jgi:hypothetical protein
MMTSEQRDNSTFLSKLKIRRSALAQVKAPIIMETNGGLGKLYTQLYRDCEPGIVFEKDPKKADILAQQRPGWRVYECDCVNAIAQGIGADLAVNFLDVDPYGEPWSILQAFFERDRSRAETLHVVVNDGITQLLQTKGAWAVKVFEPIVERFGNDFYRDYEQVCQIMMQEKAALAGYSLSRWYITKAKTTGSLHNYHYWAVLSR